MVVLPPGTLLQLMYLEERLALIPAGKFVEIGPGSGEITSLLLKAGWEGSVYDLSNETIAKLEHRFAAELISGRLSVIHGSYLESAEAGDADLIISCMVMEHLDADAESMFMQQSAKRLKKGGCMIGLVPASERHWGIEDDIAGHFRRYSRESLTELMNKSGWNLTHVAGLTYPVSNMLLPLSNLLVRRNEQNKLSLTQIERTKQSGRRTVRFKTTFPLFMAALLNKYTMLPLFWIQKLFLNSKDALVLYFEANCLANELSNEK